MKPFVFFLMFAFIACGAQAQESSIAFDGDFYKKISEDLDSAVKVVEYIPQRENASDWTRKITFRHYPHLTDARATGAMLDATIKQKFCTVVAQTRRPGASTGRPVVMKQPAEVAETRRR